jgi:hypothetical protein
MKKLIFLFAVLMLHALYSMAQSKPKALPRCTYKIMVASITSADITLLQGNGGSISIDKENIGILKDFIETSAGQKMNGPQTATLMCLINGREYLSGRIYINDTQGSVTFTMDGKEYVNELNAKGTSFFKSMLSQ